MANPNQQQQPPPQQTRRSLTGFVTKLVGDAATYGFINDEIFFPQTIVSGGGPASVGDQVFAECEYNAQMPIKWNATSIKILNKASAASNQNLDLINQQQQSFNQPPPSTYQQHRQQQQQQQPQQQNRQDDLDKSQHQASNQAHPVRLLDQANENFYNSSTNPTRPAFLQQTQLSDANSIQPFNHDQPMGPPNFAYTAQLGSAFVQNQFVPAPFLNQQQQPPSLLGQHQSMLPNNNNNNNGQNNHQNQRHNQQHNKGNDNRNNRFNNDNRDGRNDSRQNNRNRNNNRNDNTNKFDRSASGDRDNSFNNRNRKNNSRERSVGRVPKRDETPQQRPSPPTNVKSSNASVSSDKVKSRRHYEVQNVPKSQIMTNLNAYNMKQRCSSSVHVPSDLNNVIVNSHFRLNLKNTPKPILFKIEPAVKAEETVAKVVEASVISSDPNDEKKLPDENQASELQQPEGAVKSEQPTPPVSKSDLKLSHKYGVKVLLLSLPDMETIYHGVFGENLDSFQSDNNKAHRRLDDIITLLCNKGSNNGISLIGGKFDPTLDGFIEGESNEFERHKRKPDLIATCKRVVSEQIGLDLGACRSWTLLSTFLYNNKSDYFSSKASVEYSYIYMPELWTMLTDSFDKNVLNIPEIIPERVDAQSNSEKLASETDDTQNQNQNQVEDLNSEESQKNDEAGEVKMEQDEVGPSIQLEGVLDETKEETKTELNVENLSELKVTDLKAQLDERNIKYKNGVKKAELIALLQECLQPNQSKPPAPLDEDQSMKNVETNNEQTIQTESLEEPKVTEVEDAGERQLEEGEVLPGPSETNSPMTDVTEPDSNSEGKRKADDEADDQKVTKKKKQRVDLIRDPFIVRTRDAQQQLSLVPLYDATLAGRHDQFELSVSSSILKEAVVQHFSEYIMTTLIEDNKQKISSSSNTLSGGTQSVSSQETTSDTNNNTSKDNNGKTASGIQTLTKTQTDSKAPTSTTNLKEYPVDRYINLAFTFFDSSHMGFIYFEDLNKLFNNTGLTISKRALTSLVGDGEKFYYKTLPDISPKLSPSQLYELPPQFTRLPRANLTIPGNQDPSTIYNDAVQGVKLVEFKGVVYDVEKLINQLKDAETLNVSLVDRFNYAIQNSDKQTEEIHILEVSQKSLAKAIKAQNDEICDLKRERDSMKKKCDSIKKGVKGTISSLTDLIKEDREDKK